MFEILESVLSLRATAGLDLFHQYQTTIQLLGGGCFGKHLHRKNQVVVKDCLETSFDYSCR